MPSALYRIESLGRHLGVGVAGSRYVYLSAVAKENGANAPYCIANELICGELGRFLRLPVPPVGIVTQAGSGPMVASLDFNLTGNSLPPVNVNQCVRMLPTLSAGLLLFDVWIANCDRHEANFSVDTGTTPPQMSIFDHSHALFGYATGQGEARLTALRDRLGISWTTNGPVDSGQHRHCLLDFISTDGDFHHWLERIRSTPDFFIDEVCRDAMPYGATLQEAQAAAGFLKHRRDNLRNIINHHRAEFTAITTWNLPL
jgi:hypothetical protein